MPDFAAELQRHLDTEHKRSPFSQYLKEIVYGGTDGIVTTFAVIAGFTGANTFGADIAIWTVLLFGFANLLADGVSMGLGNYLSVRAEQGVYRSEKAKESQEIDTDPDFEKRETVYLLQRKGFDQADAETLTSIYVKNKPYWTEFMMNHELQMPNPEDEKPLLNGLFTFLSFIFFGLLPLVPYLFITDPWPAFWSAVGAFAFALLLLGYVRGLVAKEKIWKAMAEVFLIGGLAGLVAFGVGFFFR